MDLVDKDDVVAEEPELVLRVHQDQPTRGGHLRASCKQLEAKCGDAVEQRLGDQAFANGVRPTHIAVVLIKLGRRREDGPRQALVLAEPVTELVARDLPLALLVVEPQRGLRHPRDVRANHELERDQLTFARPDHIRVGHLQEVVRHDVSRRCEPEVRDLAEGLALEWDRPQDTVEGGLPICRHDRADARVDVAVADLAAMRRAEMNERGAVKRPDQLLGHALVRDHQVLQTLARPRTYSRRAIDVRHQGHVHQICSDDRRTGARRRRPDIGGALGPLTLRDHSGHIGYRIGMASCHESVSERRERAHVHWHRLGRRAHRDRRVVSCTRTARR